MAGTTGLEPATSDVTGRISWRFPACIILIIKHFGMAMEVGFRPATVGATVRSLRLFLRYLDFAIDQLHRLLTKLREEMLVPFQLLTLMAGVLGNHVVRHPFS
jgi:hypothetical protein